MATYAVRYTQPIMGTDAQGDLVPQPGASVRIRKNGATATIYANRTKTGLANPVPIGVAGGVAGLDTFGNLTVWLDPTDGHLYDAEVTVGGTTTIVALPTIGPESGDVLDTTSASQTKAGLIHVNAPTVVDPCASPHNASGVSGTSSYAGLVSAINALAVGGTLRFTKGGVYELQGTESLVITKRINIVADGGLSVTIRKVGTGHGVTIGAGTVGNAISGVTVAGVAFASEAGAGDALVLKAVHRSKFDIVVPSAAQAGVRMIGCILNEGRIIVAPGNLPYGAQANAVVGLAMELGEGGTGPSGCNGNRFYVLTEGCTVAPGYGINLDNGDNNVLVGGSEGNTIGIRWGAGVHHNVVHLYMEGNTGGNENGVRGNNTVLPSVGVGGSIPFASGSAAAPSITFDGDNNTGFWRIAADRIGLALGGVNVLDIAAGFADWAMDNRPAADNTYNLGLATRRWIRAYIVDLFCSGAVSFTAIPTYADNAAAVSGGLAVGAVYKTAAGEVRIRV